MTPFDPRDHHSTPFDAPLVPRLPLRLRRTEILTVVYRTEPDVAEALLPVPLELADDICLVQVYWMHDAPWFGVYGESAVQLPVRLPDGRRAVYSPYLVLGSDAAVAAGRESYGQPKKLGTVELVPNGDLLVGRVERNGIDVLTATMCWKQAPVNPQSLDDRVPGSGLNVNLRIVPEGDGEFRRELVTRTFEDVVTHEAWTGPATVELRPNAQVPVHKLAVRSVEFAMHRTVDLTLGVESVLHRYDP
jgi:acetoacetate decarboxylase